MAISTAMHCILYEKLTKANSLVVICFLNALIYFILALLSSFSSQPTNLESVMKIPPYIFISYISTWIFSSWIWYTVTTSQNVMTSSLYEIKYIVVLSVFYIIVGENKFTLNTLLGLIFAMCSIYFVSKS